MQIDYKWDFFKKNSILNRDTSDLINYTLFPTVDPFQSDELIRIGLEFDMRKFLHEKYEEEYLNDITSLKLVTPCKASQVYQQNINSLN